MKVTSLLIAILALSSCVAKPWFVGSVNDHYSYASHEAGSLASLGDPNDLGDPDEIGAPVSGGWIDADGTIDLRGKFRGIFGGRHRHSHRGHDYKGVGHHDLNTTGSVGFKATSSSSPKPAGNSALKSFGSSLKSFGSSLKSIGSAKPKPTTKVTNP